jgi:hypothetical protein
MRGRTWVRAKPKPPPKPKVSDDIREAIDAQAISVVAAIKKRICKKPKNPVFNWPDDFFSRWHRDALYFVIVMRTPHGEPPTFETHSARMEHSADGKFNLAVPMRRGWNTVLRDASPEKCLKDVSEFIYF